MPIVLDGTNGITQADQFNSDSTFGFKNRIINGAMTIDQRNAGASVTITNTTDVTYTLDRWFGFGTIASKFSIEQTISGVSAPTGFIDYLGVTSLSAYSVLSGDSFSIGQSIEGLNVTDLAWGTASAKSITISFWVRSSLTGTFGGSIRNSAVSRSYPFTYTISAANTWEQKSLTIAGDTSGTWLTTNDVGIRVGFGLGQGSTFSGTAGAWASSNFNNATGATSVVGTNGATFYITGVQLEVGSTATSFDNLDYGRSLIQCQRYCQVISIRDNGFVGFNNSTTVGWFGYYPPVVMRTLPTLGTTGTASNYRILYAGGATACSVIPSMVSDQGTGFYRIEGTVASGLTAGQGSMLIGNNAAYNISFLAEL